MKKIALLSGIFISFFSYGIDKVEKWDLYEIHFQATTEGNPYKDVIVSAKFSNEDTTYIVSGFYNGNGIYKIRFMPTSKGIWEYQTKSNIKELNNKRGRFECIVPSQNNHGMVKVNNTFHFAYDDGKQYYPFGTTIYAWTNQPDSLQDLTLKTLSESEFNKVRMCVFPVRYSWNENEPPSYAYEGIAPDKWDYSKFNPIFFENLEKRIKQLMELGIECDLILFHPYDEGHWGFDRMTSEQDDFYLRYIIARLSAYRNIWWSLANEYDYMRLKNEGDWDRFFNIIHEEDPYKHLRSIHNGSKWYDHTKPWVTHLSIQGDTWDTWEWRDKYQKPIVIDECKYEGNLKIRWGDLTAKDQTMRIWDAVTRGGYATHGETYMDKNDIIWWCKGGVLKGESPERIGFCRQIIEGAPIGGLEPFIDSPEKWNRKNAVSIGDKFFLLYFGDRQPVEREVMLPDHIKYTIELIDTWGMTFTKLEGLYSGKTLVKLPGEPYYGLRIIKQEK